MKNMIFAEKVQAVGRFCRAKDATPPNFAGEKFREGSQNHKFAKVSRHLRLKFCIYMLFARVPERQTLDFVSLVPRPLGKRLYLHVTLIKIL